MEVSPTELDLKLSIRSVACAFNTDHSAVKWMLLRGYEGTPGRGRHRELSPDVERALVEWVATAYDNKAVNPTKSLNYRITIFGTAVSKRWRDSFMSRSQAELFETKSSPQKNQRLKVPRIFFEAAIEGARTHVHNACAELVFNLGEIEIS
jgi:hypothetical protein